jgi:hypothetical protein
MQIFLNGEELDLYKGEVVAITLQINDLGELDKANTSYTNSFKIPRSANNTRIMQNLGIPGNSSRIMYSLNNITILEDSLPILVNGFAKVTEVTPLYYSINVYGSEKTFFEKIKNVTVKDCFPTINISWTAGSLKSYANATLAFCFPVAQYNTDTIHSGSLQSAGAIFSKTKVIYTSPVFFAKYLFEQIFIHLGYTLDYPIANDNVFLKLVVPSQNGVSSFGLQYGDTFNIKNCVQDVGADVYIKEIMYRFGLIIQVDELNKRVSFTKMDNLLNAGTPKDWTDKMVEFKSEKYEINGYGQVNYMRYAEDDEADENFPYIAPDNELTGSFNLDVETYNAEQTVISSVAIKPKIWGQLESNDWSKGIIYFYNQPAPNHSFWMFDIAENKKNDLLDNLEIPQPKGVPFQFLYLKTLPNVMQFFLSPNGADDAYNLPQTVKSPQKDFLSFQYYIDNYYQNVQRLLGSPTVIKVNMKLDTTDIYNFNFFTRIYLEQFGSFFYLNKINNWQKNKLAEVELIRIPPISTGGGYYSNSSTMIGTP